MVVLSRPPRASTSTPATQTGAAREHSKSPTREETRIQYPASRMTVDGMLYRCRPSRRSSLLDRRYTWQRMSPRAGAESGACCKCSTGFVPNGMRRRNFLGMYRVDTLPRGRTDPIDSAALVKGELVRVQLVVSRLVVMTERGPCQPPRYYMSLTVGRDLCHTDSEEPIEVTRKTGLGVAAGTTTYRRDWPIGHQLDRPAQPKQPFCKRLKSLAIKSLEEAWRIKDLEAKDDYRAV